MEALQQLDANVLEWFISQRTQFRTQIMLDITALGGYTVMAIVTIFSVGFLLVLGRRRTAVFVLGAIISGSAVMETVKLISARDRPPTAAVEIEVIRPASASFPSGHSMISAMVYLTLAILVAGRLQGRKMHIYLIGCSLILTCGIGVSRLYLGVHYFTDVVVGWLAGLLWALSGRWIATSWLAGREKTMQVLDAAETAKLAEQ